LVLLIVTTITIFHTYGRYISDTIFDYSVQLAKWSIIINDEVITNNTNMLNNSIDLINSSNNTTYLEAGDECYFDITINPTSTEVAISYSIEIDLTSGNNKLPTGTKIEKYELYTGDLFTLDSTVNIDSSSVAISDIINLTDRQALDSNSIRKYRIYCLLPNDAIISNGETFEVNPTITLKQYI
jgi:hypothetical protein